ncbi:hypothetical protein B0H13DRAFT_1878317 [Mycena leptocephala]|nr:hypothetical protein B0H13DRAFT_1878317 [Mycena leptocephala]
MFCSLFFALLWLCGGCPFREARRHWSLARRSQLQRCQGTTFAFCSNSPADDINTTYSLCIIYAGPDSYRDSGAPGSKLQRGTETGAVPIGYLALSLARTGSESICCTKPSSYLNLKPVGCRLLWRAFDGSIRLLFGSVVSSLG